MQHLPRARSGASSAQIHSQQHQLVAFVLALALLLLPAAAPAADLEVGAAAPDFALQGSDGKTYTLAGLLAAGKPGVVLAWFPKAFTPG